MRTVDVAMQTVFPAHWRWTWRSWVMGVLGEADTRAAGLGRVKGTAGWEGEG